MHNKINHQENQSQEKMQTSAGSSKVFIIVGIFLLLVLIGVYAFDTIDNQKQQKNQLIGTISPSGILEPISNWKFYASGEALRKKHIKYTIKYPSSWSAHKKNPERPTAVPWVTFREYPISEARKSSCVSISGSTAPATDIDTYIKQQDNPEPHVLTTEKIIINGKTGVKRHILKENESHPLWQIFLKDSVNIFKFESCPDTDENLFDQILSTFQTSQ